MSGDQNGFAAALLAPEAAVPPGLSDPSGRPAGKRFDVYRNNVVASLTEALATAFPVVRRLVGEANFRTMAGAFVRRHPPRSPVLMLYGGDLPRFLEEWPPAKTLGYLPDVARLEQALRESYHAADAVPVDPSTLGALPPERLVSVRLGLAPAVRVVRSPWPILSVWRYNAVPGSPRPAAGAQDVAVVRPGYVPEPLLLPRGGAALLAALGAGAALGDATEAAAAEAPRFDLAPVLTMLLSSEALTMAAART